jgi:hypothetical protein
VLISTSTGAPLGAINVWINFRWAAFNIERQK